MIHASEERLADLALSRLAQNPLLAWDNVLARATLSGSAVAADGARENAASWTTYDRWRPAGDGLQSLSAAIGAGEAPVTFLAVAAHNLAAIGAAVQWHYTLAPSGDAWVPLGPAIPAEAGVMAWRILPLQARQWRLSLILPAGQRATVGVVFIGSELILPLPLYQGFAPVIVPTEIALETNVSEGGNLLGSAIVRTGSSLTVPLSLLPSAFVRGAFKPVMDWFNRGRGVFFAWRPGRFPEDVHYGWRSGGVIRPENSGPRDLMSASLEMRIYDG